MIASRSVSSDHGGMAQYHVTVVSGDSSRTAAEAAADAGAKVIRKLTVTDGVAALATDEQIAALTEAGHTVHRHADLAEGRAERLAEYSQHYNIHRPHRSLRQHTPTVRRDRPAPAA